MKIRFIEPRAPDLTVFDQALLPRLGLPLLGRVLMDAGHDVRIYAETLAPVDWTDVGNADLVGFSATTATAPAAYRMARRSRADGIRTIIGGPHVSFEADEALDACDFVVRREGHAAIQELIMALETQGHLGGIAGLSYHDDAGGKVHNAPRPFCSQAEYAALPAPDLSLIVGNERMTNVPVMTQWGCPFDCDFCSVIKMFGRRVRARHVDDVLVELERYRDRDSVFFYDDNFIVNKTRTSALLRGMVERDFGLRWSAQMRADTVYKNKKTREIDHALLALMRASGCQMVYCGFESVNPESLKAYNKRIDIDTIEESVRAFHEYGIAVHGMFVLGSDADEPRTIEQTAMFATRNRIDTVQFMMLTPIPGTALFERIEAEGRLLSRDWSLYDGHHCLIQPAKMTPFQLQVETHKALGRFYLFSRSVAMLIRNIIHNLPMLFDVLVQERTMRARLPRLPAMLLSASRRAAVPATFGQLLSRKNRQRVTAAVLVPLLRLYARRHMRRWARQSRSGAYLEFLRGIAATGAPLQRLP
jgi:anaerobic magnesium-protoporphyrin IX monomethyl ester cyclase